MSKKYIFMAKLTPSKPLTFPLKLEQEHKTEINHGQNG